MCFSKSCNLDILAILDTLKFIKQNVSLRTTPYVPTRRSRSVAKKVCGELAKWQREKNILAIWQLGKLRYFKGFSIF